MKLIFYFLSLQVTFSMFFVNGANILSRPRMGQGREKRQRYKEFTELEHLHMPDWYKVGPQLESSVNGTALPDVETTPDYRLTEPPFMGNPNKYWYNYYEEQRPIRISPHYKQIKKWAAQRNRMFMHENKELPRNLGCYCTTVYRRLVLLAGCALITKRHILTTASSTDLILDRYLPKKPKSIDEILGAWYDINRDVWNSSVYGAPARIHHHPGYGRPNTVNISHPIPVRYDLSVWALLHNTHRSACLCLRGASHGWEYYSSTPRWPDIAHIVGFQFVKAFRKVPTPWHKYVVRTKKHIVPCPKTEWGWFHCILGNWAKFGLESGAAWHRALENRYWLYDGLIGMAAFSMNLRSEELTHYFTVINSNFVLDFLYDAYNGLIPPIFLDGRFENTKWGVPKVIEEFPMSNAEGYQGMTIDPLPVYKKK